MSLPSSPAGPARRTSVFISYARSDALAFARRLASDLDARGYSAWLDLEAIDKGTLWEVRIEQGIRAAGEVLAVLTASSAREESVCRDKIVFALNEGKPVVPLRVDPSPDLKPTLLLARGNWIDFTVSYEQGLEALLRHLAGDVAAARAPALPQVMGVVPLDFGVELARYTAGFTGRDWLAKIWANPIPSEGGSAHPTARSPALAPLLTGVLC